jgi:endonuclease/exonuclease/phosphatase family metal-dependent hydrolase
MFLAKLQNIQPPTSCPWLAVGDYNLTRSPTDKNTADFNWALANRFNRIIDELALIELPLLDRLYIWSNKRDSPTLARLDRAFINTEFCYRFPNSSLSSRLGTPSDHIPLLVTVFTSLPKTHLFRFENAWLQKKQFPPYSPARLVALLGGCC